MKSEALETDPVESARDPRDARGAGAARTEGRPATWSTLAPNASGTESSAFIPAARPVKKENE